MEWTDTAKQTPTSVLHMSWCQMIIPLIHAGIRSFMMVFIGSHVFQATPHIVGLVALCTGTYTHQFSCASGHSTHSWAYRTVYQDMNSVERDNNNPCSVVSHHGSFDAIVMMFGVRLPVWLETQQIHSSKFLGGYQHYLWESHVSTSPCDQPDFLHIRTCSLELCLIKEANSFTFNM